MRFSPPKQSRELEMRRPYELINRHEPLQAEAARDQPGGVPREGGGIARDGDHRHDRRSGQRLGLPRGAGARRIEHRGGIAGQRIGRQRIAGEVAALDGDGRSVHNG